MDTIKKHYQKWGVFVALFIFAAVILTISKFLMVNWGYDWPRWVTIPLGLGNLFGACGLVILSVKKGVSHALKVPGLLLYYLFLLVVGMVLFL